MTRHHATPMFLKGAGLAAHLHPGEDAASAGLPFDHSASTTKGK
jgi:hypothetical protein